MCNRRSRLARTALAALGIASIATLMDLTGCGRRSEPPPTQPARRAAPRHEKWREPPSLVKDLPRGARAKLAENGFVVLGDRPSYSIGNYMDLSPNFITSDSILYVFGCLFRGGLHQYEKEHLAPATDRLTKAGLEAAEADYRQRRSQQNLDEPARRNLLFFAVAAELLGHTAPAEVAADAKALARNVREADTRGYYPDEDYTVYKVRGDYASDPALASHFQATKWLSRQILPIIPGASDTPAEADTKLRQAALLGLLLQRHQGLRKEWEYLYDELGFFIGTPDSVTPPELAQVADRLLPSRYDVGKRPALGQASALQTLRNEFAHDTYAPSAIFPIPQDSSGQAPSKYVQFLGERYIVDGQVMQETCEPYVRDRYVPTVLEIAATVLHSDRGLQHLRDEMQEYPALKKQLTMLRREFGNVGAKSYASVYEGWIGALGEVVHPDDPRLPDFMQNEAWEDKSLNTALASWAQLRHDFILYAKQPMIPECMGMEALVEPVPGFYARMEELAKQLADRDFVGMSEFAVLCNNLQRGAQQQLAGKPFREWELDAEYHFYIGKFGQWLLKHFEPHVGPEQPCVVADVCTNSATEQVLHAATGPLHPILVVATSKIHGETLYRGFVMSYHEFRLGNSQRLTDEEWQRLVAKRKHYQHRPDWTASFLYPERH